MKKIMLFLLPVSLLFSFSVADSVLTKEEKQTAATYLKATEKELFSAVKGLSEAQLKFKPSPEKWSVEDCVKHITISEQNLWQMVSDGLKKPANPEKRSEIKVSDEDVMKMVADRSQKAQAGEQLRPENVQYKSTAEALDIFKEKRSSLISYLRNSKDDFRNHVTDFPIGSMDAYQMVLLIAAHTKRHTLQIEEVKADPNFPKK